MALFSYKCPVHGNFRKSLPRRSAKEACPQCGVECFPVIKAAGTCQAVETMDNGLMPKAVERLCDIEQIMKDRAEKGPETSHIELIGQAEETQAQEEDS